MKTFIITLPCVAAWTASATAQINPRQVPTVPNQPGNPPTPMSPPLAGTPQGPRGVPQPVDPFARCLFAPEEVMAHQGEIGLQDDQRAKLSAEASKAEPRAAEGPRAVSGQTTRE